MRGPHQPPHAKRAGHDQPTYPERRGHGYCSVKSGNSSEEHQADGHIIVPGWLMRIEAGIEIGMLFVEQSIKPVLALQRDADAPRRRTDWMQHPGLRFMDDSDAVGQGAKLEVTVLPPGFGETLIETAQCLEYGFTIKAIGRRAGSSLQPGDISFPIGGFARQRDENPAGHCSHLWS